MKIENVIKYSDCEIKLREDELMELTILEHVAIEISLVKKLIDSIKKVGNGNKFPTLVVINDWSLPDEKTRIFVAQKDSNPYSIADAFVIQSLSQRIIANFYLQVNKPQRPTKIFTDKAEAVVWLKTFL